MSGRILARSVGAWQPGLGEATRGVGRSGEAALAVHGTVAQGASWQGSRGLASYCASRSVWVRFGVACPGQTAKAW